MQNGIKLNDNYRKELFSNKLVWNKVVLDNIIRGTETDRGTKRQEEDREERRQAGANRIIVQFLDFLGQRFRNDSRVHWAFELHFRHLVRRVQTARQTTGRGRQMTFLVFLVTVVERVTKLLRTLVCTVEIAERGLARG